MATGLEPLRDDDISTICGESASFGDGRRGTHDYRAGVLDPMDRRGRRQAKVKADNARAAVGSVKGSSRARGAMGKTRRFQTFPSFPGTGKFGLTTAAR